MTSAKGTALTFVTVPLTLQPQTSGSQHYGPLFPMLAVRVFGKAVAATVSSQDGNIFIPRMFTPFLWNKVVRLRVCLQICMATYLRYVSKGVR